MAGGASALAAGLLEAAAEQPGLDHDPAALQVPVEDAVEALEVEHHPAPDGDGGAAHPGAVRPQPRKALHPEPGKDRRRDPRGPRLHEVTSKIDPIGAIAALLALLTSEAAVASSGMI